MIEIAPSNNGGEYRPKNCSKIICHIFHAGTGFWGTHNFLLTLLLCIHELVSFFSKETLNSYLDFVMPLLHAMNADIFSV